MLVVSILSIFLEVHGVSSLRERSARTVDGITMVQKIRGDQKTFAEVADRMMSIVLHEGTEN